MRPPFLILAPLIGLLLAGHAGGAWDAAASEGVAAKHPMLRGPLAARTAAVKPAPVRLPVVFLSKASPAPVDSGQCRLACAEAYYACLGGVDTDDCPTGWTRCLAPCSPSAIAP